MRCKGMQVVSDQQNMCLDPPCENYSFYQLDNTEKVCVFNTTFHALAVTLLTMFIIVEIGLQELKLRITRKVVEAYPLRAAV